MTMIVKSHNQMISSKLLHQLRVLCTKLVENWYKTGGIVGPAPGVILMDN